MTTTSETDAIPPPTPIGRRWELAPLVWIPVGLLLLGCELVAIRVFPSAAYDVRRADIVVLATLAHCLAVLLGTLALVLLPRGPSQTIRNLMCRASPVVFGIAALATHVWMLQAIFAQKPPPKTLGLDFDPVFGGIVGLYVAALWLVFQILVAIAAWIATLVRRSRSGA